MKIAFIGQKGIPALSGGVEKHVEQLAKHLVLQGDEVTAYVRSYYTDPAMQEFEGVKLIHMPTIRTKHLDAISHTFFSICHALFQDYDIIHFHSIGPSSLSFILKILKPRTRVIATFHSRDYFHKKWGVIARLYFHMSEFLTCHVPDKTIAISETLFQHAKQKYGKELVCIPNGATVVLEPDTAMLSQFGLRPNRYVLSVSRLIEHKGIHYLIKAFRELEMNNKMPNNFKLVIVGTHSNTPEYEQCLKVMAEGHPNIVFLGEQTGKNLNALYTHAALFVQPSEEEGLSLALLEAMGYGLLSVVSDIPANVEAVQHDCGAVFESKNVESLKKVLAYFINRPDEATAIGRVAQARVAEHYSWDAIAKRTGEVYEEALKKGSAGKDYAHVRTK